MPERYYARSLNLIPFGGYEYARFLMSDVVINFMLYAPFGFLLSMKLKKRKNGFVFLLIPLITSVLLETVQYVLALGATDITDVISNFMGAVFGFYLFSAVIFKHTNKLNNVYIIMMFVVACFALILMI